MTDVKPIDAPAFHLIDETFDASGGVYHLSIAAEENAFSCAILDSHTNKYVALLSELPSGSFKSVTCAVGCNKFTLVPAALFEEENMASLLGFNHEVKEDEEIHADDLRSIDARNIFAVPRSTLDNIRTRFPNVRFLHSSTSFIEALFLQHKNSSGKRVFANFHRGYFEMVILDGKELLFSNAFQYKAPEDIAYYILFVYEQLNLNPETTDLVLSGALEKAAKGHALLYTYIRNVKFASLPEGFKYSYKFDGLPAHTFFSLFTLHLCA